MSNFQKDVQLLTDLQELISDAERTANMPGYAGAVFNVALRIRSAEADEPLPEQGTLLPLHQGLAERRKRGA